MSTNSNPNSRGNSGRSRRLPLPLNVHTEEVVHITAGLSASTEVEIDGKTIKIYAKDLVDPVRLGEGEFGWVERLRHRESNHYFAVKKIRGSISDEKNNALKDMTVSMRSSHCRYVVFCYGAMYYNGDIQILMEILDIDLEKFYKRRRLVGKVPEELLAYIAYCVINALDYLHKDLRVIHRDVKPSNMLADNRGNVKLCDFGISGELVNSLVNTNVGSEPYMAPERISVKEGEESYGIKSDVWSLGISLLEMAIGEFPYRNCGSIFERLKWVVDGPSPQLCPSVGYSADASDIIDKCLQKGLEDRLNYRQLMAHPFLASLQVDNTRDRMAEMVKQLTMQTNNGRH